MLPTVDESKLLDYVMAANGTFARGRRPGLEVCMPVSFSLQPLRGLAPVAAYAQWGFPRVPMLLVMMMLGRSRRVCEAGPREALFHLCFAREADCDGHWGCADGWHLEWPDQEASEDRVRPLVTGAGTSTERAIIELHSHHGMRAEFSRTDNEDESQGFRIYAVIGEIFESPKICARVGLFGHFMQWTASEFF